MAMQESSKQKIAQQKIPVGRTATTQVAAKRSVLLTRWLVLIAYAALIFYMSSQRRPLGDFHMPFASFDKLIHAAVYALLAGLFAWAMQAWPVVKFKTLALALLLSTAYGLSDEWHQSFVPGRDADLMDVLADFTGALLALRLLWWQATRRKNKEVHDHDDTQV